MVRVNGATGDDGTGDGTITAPFASIQAAIAGAVAQTKTVVAVAGGSYTGFSAASGVSVVGGYDQSFVLGGPDGATAVTITADPGATAVIAANLAQPLHPQESHPGGRRWRQRHGRPRLRVDGHDRHGDRQQR